MNTEEMQKLFSIDAICRDDLLSAGLDEALVWQLTDGDMQSIADEIADIVQEDINNALLSIVEERQQTAIDEID